MKTKHLLTGLVLPALFAACTAEEIETSKGVITQEDLSARPAVGSVALNFGETGSRAELGDNSFNSIVFNANEDAIGARIIDTYSATETKDAKTSERIAWADYTIVDDYASSNYQYVYNGKSWETTALMVEGNYMFYFPYNKKNVARGPLEIITPVLQTVKPNEDGGERNAIAELYASENPAFVGYKFIAAENQGLSQNVEMQHLFAYPQITLVNDFLVANKKGDKVETDLTISKIVLSADNLYAKYIVNHTNFRNSLTEEVSWYTSKTAEDPTVKQEAGDWTDAESFLKKASIESITMAQAEGAKTVDITVEFEDGLELAYGEEYVFNVVLPATTYGVGTLTMKVYTDDDKMIGEKTIDGDETLYNEALFDNAKKMTFAPGKRYSTQEYNFPNVGNPSPKKSAGNSGIYELGGSNLCLIDAVAPVAVINTIEEFEAFLETIDKNENDLVEITKATERKANENNFILAPAYDEKGNVLDYANLAVDEAFLALLDEYNYNGKISFVSKMNIKGAAQAPDAEKEIEEFILGSDDYEMVFDKAVVKNGYVTVNQMTTIADLVVESGLVTVKGNSSASAAIAAATVKGGEMTIKSAKFDPAKVTASYALNTAEDAVANTGKVTLDYTGTTAAAKVEGGKLVIGSNVKINAAPDWKPVTVGTTTTVAEITNNGEITANVTVNANVALTNNGKMTGTNTNNGTITANKTMTVATNNGKVVVGDKKVTLTVSAGSGKVENKEAGKVVNTANQVVYASIPSLKNYGTDNNTDVLAKYDTHSGVTRFIITGEWEFDNTGASNSGALAGKEIEFASGSSLYVHNATLTMPGKVIINADVNWTGRDKTNAVVVLPADKLEFTKKANGTYNNVTVSDLSIKESVSGSDVSTQAVLLKQVAENGGTATLTGNAVLDAPLKLKADATINLNSKTVSVTLADQTAATAPTVLGMIEFTAAVELTIGGGTMNAANTWSAAQSGHANSMDMVCFKMNSVAGAKLTISSGTYTTGLNSVGNGSQVVLAGQNNTIAINGGTFKTAAAVGVPTSTGAKFVWMPLAGSYSTWTVANGAVFYNYNPNAALKVEEVCDLKKLTTAEQTVEGMCYKGAANLADTALLVEYLDDAMNNDWLSSWKEIKYTVKAAN